MNTQAILSINAADSGTNHAAQAVPDASRVGSRQRLLPRSRSGAAIAFAHFAFFTATLVILGSAIGWPDVLREPPAVIFERIRAAPLATLIGYSSYLLSSLLMVPLAFLLRDLFKRGGVEGWVGDTLAFIGAAAGVLKTIGIVRWLLAMPALAQQHAVADSDAARRTVELVFQGVNGYGGSVGELLGVALFSGVWFLGLSLTLLLAFRQRVVGVMGLVLSALTLALVLRPFHPPIGAVEMIGGPLWLLWLLALSVALWRARG